MMWARVLPQRAYLLQGAREPIAGGWSRQMESRRCLRTKSRQGEAGWIAAVDSGSQDVLVKRLVKTVACIGEGYQ